MRRLAVLVALVAGLVTVALPASAATDRRRPVATITTADGAVVVAAPREAGAAGAPSLVTGRATDDVAGIRSVRVLYCSGGSQADGWSCGGTFAAPLDPIVERAGVLRCTSSTRRSCSWSATVPETPGSYLVFVTATDRVGRTRSAGPIQIFVV